MAEAIREALTSQPQVPTVSTLTIHAPATGEVVGSVPVLSEREVREAVERVRVAQRSWGRLAVDVRAERVGRLAETLLARTEEMINVIVRETGKPYHEALAHEVIPAVDMCHYFSKHAARILADVPLHLHLLKHRRSYVRYAPMGVVGVISPWNFPLLIPFGSLIEALIAGNGVVVKPSEVTPLTMLKVKEIVDASGMPADLVQVVTGDGRTGSALIDAGVQKVVFTGAVGTGRRVGAACGERLIPCVLELGGKAPLIACDDCDVERTARAVVLGGFANSGQICISVERVLAHEAIHDALVDRVVELTKQLRQGDPDKAEVDLGAIIFPRQIDIAEAHVRDAVTKGAIVATGGQRRPGPGMFFEPTVLTNCRAEMSVMREEIFGPIVPIMKVRDEEEAIRVANDSALGLYAYVFTQDKERGKELAERIEAGTVMVNDVLVAYGAVEGPFGGIKASGYGRVHSDDSLRAMCHGQHINYERVALPLNNPLSFPYTTAKYRALFTTLRVLFSRRGMFGKLVDLF